MLKRMPTFMVNRKGATRIVFVFDHYVIKLPAVTSWKLFICGLLANHREVAFGSSGRFKELTRVRLWLPGGLLVVAERIRPVKHEGLFWVDLEALAKTSELGSDFICNDAYPHNFGYRGRQLVKLDYGD